MGLLGYLFATAVRILLSLAFWGAVGLSIMGLNPNAAVQEKLKQTVGTKTAQDILNAADVLASMLKRVNSHLSVYTGTEALQVKCGGDCVRNTRVYGATVGRPAM